jgi:hypothetical protein
VDPPRNQAERLAQNREGTANPEKRGRGPGRRFEKGNRANPGGRPTGLAASVRDVVDQDVIARFWGAVLSGYITSNDPETQQTVYEKVSVGDRIAVSKVIAERGWGKPAEFVPIEDPDLLVLGVREDESIALSLRARADEIARRRRQREERQRARGESDVQLGSVRRPAPETEEAMFRYRLHTTDGDDLGEAAYAQMIKAGEDLFFGGGPRFRVLAVVPFDEEDESPFVGLLQVEAA